ncbi:MAG TPA: winged helix-turn-helix transcriptional regulator, partial [Candidatus Thermoplasmatota archaeon]|nr:winged helix-turn-helix transcriptional regulator [Candidatus Thermoplasmatota archaeon]
IATAWTALADGLAAAGTALAGALAAVGSALASAAKAAWSGLTSLVTAVGRGLAAAWSALGSALAAVGAFVSGLWGRLMTQVPVEARPYALAGAGATGAGLTGLALWRLLKAFGGAAALYSRIARSDILENDARNRLFEQVRSSPGMNVSELAEATGLGWGTTVYHLQRLKATGLVSEKRGGNSKCFFVNGGAVSPAAQRAQAALRHEKAQQIVTFLQANPAASQKEMAAALGLSPALVSFHVKRLVEAGVLSKARAGKANTLTLAADIAAAPIPA